MNRLTLGVIAIVSVLATGCRDETMIQSRLFADWDGQPPSDSGATLVISAEALAAPPTLELRETLRIGERDRADYSFGGISNVAPASNGDVFVLDSRNVEVVRFNLSGKQLNRFGRKGEGPGDFNDARAMAVAGDTVFLLDLRRVQAFSYEGRVLSVSPGDPLSVGDGITSVEAFAVTNRGLIVAKKVGVRGTPETKDPQTDSTVLLIRPKAGGEFVRLCALPRLEWFPVYRPYQRRTSVVAGVDQLARPFAPGPQFAISARGDVFYAAGDRYVIDILSCDGKPSGRIVGKLQGIAIPVADHERVAARSKAYLDTLPAAFASRREQLERSGEVSRRLATVKFRPIIGRLIAGDSGALLVERVDLGPIDRPISTVPDRTLGDTHWDVIEARGLMGRFTMPQNFKPLAFRAGKLYGVSTDSLGVQNVVRYEIVPK